jgi:hypothetical protein
MLHVMVKTPIAVFRCVLTAVGALHLLHEAYCVSPRGWTNLRELELTPVCFGDLTDASWRKRFAASSNPSDSIKQIS